MADAPKDRRYLKSHEWAQQQEDVIIVGITSFAVQELSDLVFVDLPEVGAAVTAGDPFGEVESVKAVSELLAPVSGTVAEVNEDLENSLETIVESPWEDGWMIKIRPTDPSEYKGLLDHEAYTTQLNEG